MATEIERKFLTQNNIDWATIADSSTAFSQGYLSTDKNATVRVRIEGEIAKLTIKGQTSGISRTEFEYPIPLNDAQVLLAQLCQQPLIDKTRHCIKVGHHVWEVDEFHGDNQGLIVAEIELHNENESFLKPEWLGAEVSDDPRYFNSQLIANPFTSW